MLPIAAVQETVYNVLTAALASVPVLDQAGVNQAYPYVTIGEFLAGSTDTLTNESVDLEMTVHVWSRQLGMQECADLMQAIKDALDRKAFPSPDFQWVSTIWNYAQTMRDPDGRTRHGILRFQVLTFELAGST
jgi:hypothetical protein